MFYINRMRVNKKLLMFYTTYLVLKRKNDVMHGLLVIFDNGLAMLLRFSASLRQSRGLLIRINSPTLDTPYCVD